MPASGQKRPPRVSLHNARLLQKGSPRHNYTGIADTVKHLFAKLDNFVRQFLLHGKIDLEGRALALNTGNRNGTPMVAHNLL